MSKPKFWQLAPPAEDRFLAERYAPEIRFEIVKCPIAAGHQRAGKRLSGLSVFLPPNSASDIVWTWHSDCLISRRALDVLVRNQLTGFATAPAVTRFKNLEKSAAEFLEFRPIGWGGVAPPISGVQLVDFCEGCGSTEYSIFTRPELLVDQLQWDGSDFFVVWPLPKYIFMSSRARDVIVANRLTGAVIRPLEELEPAISTGLSPGKLEYWFPKEKVEEIKAKYDGIE